MQPHVVVIDDDEDIRASLENLLASAGFDCTTYESSERFLDVGVWGQSVCILLDVTMLGMSGLDLQERLVAMGVQKPVVVMTARLDEETRERAIRNGAIDVVAKPFDDDRLIDLLEKLRDENGNG